MKKVGSGIEFTPSEQAVMMVGGSHLGLRAISQRTGDFSVAKMPMMHPSVRTTATKLLNQLGDMKLTGESITKMCEWACETNK